MLQSMRIFISYIFLFNLICVSLSGDEVGEIDKLSKGVSQGHNTFWEESFVNALNMGKEKRLPLLLFFTGSDWSVDGMKMNNEVFTSSFKEKISPCFVCMEIDFPKHSELSSEKVSQNEELKEFFHR